MAKNMSQRKAAEVAIQERFARLNDSLSERSRRLFAASEALALQQRGHDVKKNTVARLLTQLGYSLQGNKKCLEGAQHPDRNAQFEHINEMVRAQLHANAPAISVDTKKKEVVGSYKNSGRE